MSIVVNMKYEGYDVDITRRGKWGNPYHIGAHGTRKEVIEKYERYIRGNKKLMDCIGELDLKRLGCVCHPKPCHGDVLVKLVNELYQKSIFP